MSDSLTRRDWFVGNAVRRAAAIGLPVSPEAVQRQAAADLTMLDNVRRAGLLREKTEKKQAAIDVIAQKRALRAEAQAAKIGGRVRRRRLPAKDPARKGITVTGVEAEKLHAMALRIRAIGERARTIRTGEDMEHAFAYPGLARRAWEAQVNHDAQRGEYAGKSELDRFRILFATLGKICDDSNAVFRVGWWVKK